MNSTPGFFTTLFSVCRGTADFPVFVRNNFGKVLWQFFLLAFFIALAVAALQSVKLHQELSDVRRVFVGAFGEKIVFGRRGFFPARDEDRARSIVLPRKGRLCYTGNNPDAARVLGDLGGIDYLILWRGGAFVAGHRREDHTWTIVRPGEKENFFTAPDQDSALEILLKEPEPRAVADTADATVSLPVGTIGRIFLLAYATVLFVFQLTAIVTTGLFATGFFTLLFSVGSHRKLVRANLWKSGIYAGFPAMLIAGCFPLLDLPFFNYLQVYLFALIVYWIPVAAHIENQWDRDDSASHGGFYDN